MTRGESGPGELEWEEPQRRARPARSRSARATEARAIVERLGWTARPWVYWAGSNRSDPRPDADWSAGQDSAEEIIGRRLQHQAIGAYAVALAPAVTEGTGARSRLSLARLNPTAAEILSLGEEIASGSLRLSESRRFHKAMPKLVGDVEQWRHKQELALRDAREVVDAAQRRQRDPRGVPAFLPLESLCIWLGPRESRPSVSLSNSGLLEAVENNRSGAAGLPSAGVAALWALIGQRRLPGRPLSGHAGWHRCGKLLPAWPLDILIHLARRIGGAHALADQIEAAPEIAAAPVAELFRELLLTLPRSAIGEENGPDLLLEALAGLPNLARICKRVEAEPTRRLSALIEIQRQSIDDAIAVSGATGSIILPESAFAGKFDAAQDAARHEFWTCYFRNIAAAMNEPPEIIVGEHYPGLMTGRYRQWLQTLLFATFIGSHVMLDFPEGSEDYARPALTFGNLSAYACELIWRAGAGYARLLVLETWQARFLIAATRMQILSSGAIEGLDAWMDVCCATCPPGVDAHNHLCLAMEGLQTVDVRARASGWSMETRAAAFAAVGRHGARLFDGPDRSAVSKATVEKFLPFRAVETIDFICAAVGAGIGEEAIVDVLELDLLPAAKVLLALQPRRLAALLSLAGRLLVKSPDAATPEARRRILEGWGLVAAPGRTWGAAFALLNPGMIEPYFVFAHRFSRIAADRAEAAQFMQWLFGIALPSVYVSDVDALRTAMNAGHGRAKSAFLSRHADELLRRADEVVKQTASARIDGSNNDAFHDALRIWRGCVDIACEWAELQLPNALAAFDRLLRHYAPGEKNPWIDFYASQWRRAQLRLSEGDPDRALVLLSARLDLSWDEAELIGKAWDCLELIEDLRRFIGRLIGQRDSTLRAVRWLSRLGLCLRLQGESRVRERLRSLWESANVEADAAATVAPAGLPENVAPELASDLRRLCRLRGDGTFSNKVEDILRRPIDLAEELNSLEARSATLSRAACARVENLREKLAHRDRLEQWIAHDLEAAMPEQLLKELERIVRELMAGHLRKIIGELPASGEGDDLGRNWDNAARLYFTVDKNRKALKRLLLHEARGNRQWLRDFAPNRQFLDRMDALGINTAAWLGPHFRVVNTPLGEWKLELEANPLEVLRMGNYFGTCLSEGRENAYATIANACDANKRVVYVRDSRRNVIGRKLLVMTPEGEILGFRSYGLSSLDPNIPSHSGSSPWMKVLLHAFARELADACRSRLHPFPLVRADHGDPASDTWLQLSTHWYNDHPEPFDETWLKHAPEELRRAVREQSAAFTTLLDPLCDSGSDDALAQSLRAIVFLNEDAAGVMRAFLELAAGEQAAEKEGRRISEDRAGYVLQYLARYSLNGKLKQLAESALAMRSE